MERNNTLFAQTLAKLNTRIFQASASLDEMLPKLKAVLETAVQQILAEVEQKHKLLVTKKAQL